VKELRLAGVSSIAAGNAFLEAFRHDYNAPFGRTPASDHDAHRKLLKAERARVVIESLEVLAGTADSRDVTEALTWAKTNRDTLRRLWREYSE